MKKIILSFVLLACCIFSFIGFNTNAQSSFTVTTVDGVQIRNASPNGIKFIGQVEGTISGSNISYGIVFGKGIHNNLTLDTTNAVSKELDSVTEEGEFYITMINFPESAYTLYVTARAYVVVDGVYTYANEPVVRSLYGVAKAYTELSTYQTNEFIEAIVNSVSLYDVTYNLNGGNILNSIYETRNDLVRDFVTDFNEYSGKSVSSDGSDFFSNSWVNTTTYPEMSNVGYQFLTSDTYSAKWGWLLDYINSVRGENLSLSDNQAYARGEIHNFLNMSSESSYGSDYSSEEIGNGFWNSVEAYTVSNTAELIIPTNGEYFFAGWYDNAEFSGESISQVTGDCILYAKWVTEIENDTNTDVDNTDYIVTYNLYGGTIEGINYDSTLRDTFEVGLLNQNLYTDSLYNTEIAIYSKDYANSLGATHAYCYKVGFSYDLLKEAYIVDHLLDSSGSYSLPGNATSDYYIVAYDATATATVFTKIKQIQLDDTIVCSKDLSEYTDTAFDATITVTYGSGNGYATYKKDDVLPTPVKGGYEFAGWYDNAEFTGDAITTVTGELTLYAKWEKMESILSCVSDVATSNTEDALILSDENATYTWSSSNPDLYVINGGVGTVSKVYQTHQTQEVTISVDIEYNDGTIETQSKVITINPVLFNDISSTPVATYFQSSAGYTYRTTNPRYLQYGTLFSDTTKEALDIIYFSFAIPDSSGNVTIDSSYETYIEEMIKLKANDVRVVLCIDGANEAPCQAFLTITSDDTLLATFVDNIMDLVEQYNFDGVDIDWEARSSTLCPNADSMNKLMKALREEMTLRQATGGTPYLLSTAIPAADWGSLDDRFGFANLNEYVDYVNMMSYDLDNKSAGTHVSPLHKPTYGYSFSCDSAVETFVNYGLDQNKIIIGCAGYGKAYQITGTSPSSKYPGLGATGSVTQISGVTGSYTSGTVFGNAIKTLIDSGDYTEYHEYNSSGNFVGSYLYNSSSNIFVTYDSIFAIEQKYNYAKENGVGIMFWAYTEDPYDTILDTIYSCINK